MKYERSAESRRHLRISRLSWQIPVAGFLILIILNLIDPELLGLVGVLIWLPCIGIGLVCSVGSLWLAKKTRATRKHSIVGLMVFLLTTLGILWGIYSIYTTDFVFDWTPIV